MNGLKSWFHQRIPKQTRTCDNEKISQKRLVSDVDESVKLPRRRLLVIRLRPIFWWLQRGAIAGIHLEPSEPFADVI